MSYIARRPLLIPFLRAITQAGCLSFVVCCSVTLDRPDESESQVVTPEFDIPSDKDEYH